MRNLLFIIFLLMTNALYSQLLNGSFESWVWNSQDYEPEYWLAPPDFLGTAILQDTFAYDGAYSLHFRDGAGGLSEGDCKTWINGQFDLHNYVSDSLLLSFFYSGRSYSSNQDAGVSIIVNGNKIPLAAETDTIVYATISDLDDYQRYYSLVEFPSDSILRLEITSVGFALANDGCLFDGIHWIDDMDLIQVFDKDADGYNSLVDCDDNDPSIYPTAVEIANNGIDEDCDGSDLTSASKELISKAFKIFPNPTEDQIQIQTNGSFQYQIKLYDLAGQLKLEGENLSQIETRELSDGIYFLELIKSSNGEKIVHRILKGH